MEAVKSRFLLAIRKGTLPFWSDLVAKPVTASSERFDVSKYSNPAELEALGLDALKAALMSLGLKCGWVAHTVARVHTGVAVAWGRDGDGEVEEGNSVREPAEMVFVLCFGGASIGLSCRFF